MESEQYTRRSFMTLIGMGAASLALSGSGISKERKPVASLGFQLYTVRKQIEKDLEGTVRKIAGMGYVGVETYALPANLTLQKAAKVFKECELKVFGMHAELPVGDQRDNALRMADAYHCDHVIYAGWPQGDKYKDLDAIKGTANLYDEIAVQLKSKGLHFGLHNHWWEFEKTQGIYPFYYLLEHLRPEIFFEIDTYWAKTAGVNPAKIVADFGKRAPFLHIKDGPAMKGDKAYDHVPAGKGSMDFPAIVKAAEQHTAWMIVEFDEYGGDIFEGMNASAKFLMSKGLAKGKA